MIEEQKRDVVQDWLDRGKVVRAMIADDGAKMIEKLLKFYSLREIGRATDLSATYLSRVKNGHCDISPQAYLELVELYLE